VNPGEEPRGAQASPLFLDQTKAQREEKKNFETAPPPPCYLRVWMSRPPPIYKRVRDWILG